MDHRKAVNHYTKAVNKGVLKVMSKMGISTLQSYRGAQIFEAIGLNAEFVDTYFTNTPSRISGIGIDEIAAEVAARHRRAFPERPVAHAGSRLGRAISVASGRGVPHVQPGDDPQAAVLDAHEQLQDLQGIQRDS